ncbi:embryonic protein UVS.2-like isoform X1 [Ranitomeya variabilis]|uniref:embryonic protein UVS.2-like isoform X1 n=1 Tax=Ranitomeya variabilis TaxID=490064 RepID=UPI0040562920
MDVKMNLLLLLFVVGPVTSLPPPLQFSISGLKGNDIRLDEIKKLAQPESDIKEEEPEGVFSKILKVNKDKTLPVQEGDILVKTGRNAITCTQCLWPKSADGTVIVPYTLATVYNDWQRFMFKTAMEEYESLTCVRFTPRAAESNYINITSGNGCASNLGRVGGGQWLALDVAGCMYRGIIQHELNHALGFYHEHMRSDRDSYVTIMFQYISPGDLPNFNKANTNNLGVEYDYSSVMHYERDAFSNTSGQATIVPKPDPNVPIGQRDGLSVLDVSKINRLYQCNVCGNLFNQQSGNLTSANYPSAYPNNASCVFLIRTPSNQVSLTFVAFDVQSTPNCASDYIMIYDGPTKRYPAIINRTCGSGAVPPVIASTNQLLVEFSSDSSVAGTGFKALYSTVPCGGTYYAPQGNITSPNYPNNYGNNLSCNYTITAPVGRRIVLTISEFNMEYGYFCMYDHIQIQDGKDTYGPFCGLRSIPVITSHTNSLVITFYSDWSNQYKGYTGSYNFI